MGRVRPSGPVGCRTGHAAAGVPGPANVGARGRARTATITRRGAGGGRRPAGGGADDDRSGAPHPLAGRRRHSIRRIGRADHVMGGLRERHPGLRPVLFHSPYEAACWAMICHRIRVAQAATIVRRIARRYGEVVGVAGHPLPSFPPRRRSVRSTSRSGCRRSGDSDCGRSPMPRGSASSMPTPSGPCRRRTRCGNCGSCPAQDRSRRADPHARRRPPRHLPARRTAAARRDGAPVRHRRTDLATLGNVAERWRPYRSWATLLLRISHESRTGATGTERGSR